MISLDEGRKWPSVLFLAGQESPGRGLLESHLVVYFWSFGGSGREAGASVTWTCWVLKATLGLQTAFPSVLATPVNEIASGEAGSTVLRRTNHVSSCCFLNLIWHDGVYPGRGREKLFGIMWGKVAESSVKWIALSLDFCVQLLGTVLSAFLFEKFLNAVPSQLGLG